MTPIQDEIVVKKEYVRRTIRSISKVFWLEGENE